MACQVRPMAEIVIVPTSHIAGESLRAVERAIRQERPDCVAVELDLGRFMAMERGEASGWQALRSLGPWTFLMFFVLKRIQGWLGKKVGILPGSEMLKAVRLAEKEAVHVEFIDQDIGLTLERLRMVSWREKAKLLLFLFKGLTLDRVPARPGKTRVVRLDLERVPPRELVQEALEVFRREFPGLFKAMVEERDAFMARGLMALAARHEKIVAFVGAAHSSGLQRMLAMRMVYKPLPS